jgi:hypothetical protein
VGSGIAPVTRSMPPPLRDAIIGASDSAFLHGLHTAMVVGAGLAFAGALLGLLVRRGADVGHGGSVAL